jgi:DNA polymerase-3 subunit delta
VGETVADNARYNLFAMTDHALSGNTTAALKMLYGLRAEGTESAIILWSLSREIRLLYQCQSDISKGRPAHQVMQAQRIWDKRKPIVGAALQRHNLVALGKLMQQAAEADRAVKGMSDLNAWDVLTDVLMSLSEGLATS